jgi:hypothetical protein
MCFRALFWSFNANPHFEKIFKQLTYLFGNFILTIKHELLNLPGQILDLLNFQFTDENKVN